MEEIRIKLTEGQFKRFELELGDKDFLPNSFQDIHFYNIKDVSYQISISTNDTQSFIEICKFVGHEPTDYSDRLPVLGCLEFDGRKFIFRN